MNIDYHDALPYLILTIGVLFYLSPFAPLGTIEIGILGPVSASYFVAGAFAWLYTRGKVKEPPYVLAVPVVTFLLLAGMWFYFESPSPYDLSADSVLLYGVVSVFFVLGHTTKRTEWGYVATSVLAYFVCVFVVASSSLRLDLLRLDLQNPLPNAFRLLYTAGPGIPLAVVAYFVLGGNPNKKKRAYLATSLLAYVVWSYFLTRSVGLASRSLMSMLAIILGLGIPLAVVVYLPSEDGSDKRRRNYVGASLLAYVVWIVVLPSSVLLNLLSLVFAFPIFLGLGIPRVVVPYLLSEDDSKSREWTYLGVSLVFYLVWVFVFDVVVPPLFASFEGYFLLALTLGITLGTGTPLALVAYALSGVDQSE